MSTGRNPHGSYVDEEGAPHIHPDDPRPFLESRPSYSKDQALQVWEEAAQGATTVTDAAGRTITWKPGEPRLGVWDMGHKPGHKYRDTCLSTSKENSALPSLQKSTVTLATIARNIIRLTVSTNSNE